jgi:hypothetical protein
MDSNVALRSALDTRKLPVCMKSAEVLESPARIYSIRDPATISVSTKDRVAHPRSALCTWSAKAKVGVEWRTAWMYTPRTREVFGPLILRHASK